MKLKNNIIFSFYLKNISIYHFKKGDFINANRRSIFASKKKEAKAKNNYFLINFETNKITH